MIWWSCMLVMMVVWVRLPDIDSCSLQTWSAQCAMVPCLPHLCKLLSEPYSSNIYTCFAFVSTWTCIIGRMRQHCTICPQRWSHTMSGHVKSRHVQHIWLLHVFPKGNSCTTVLVHGFNQSRNYEILWVSWSVWKIISNHTGMELIETLKTWIHHKKTPGPSCWTFVDVHHPMAQNYPIDIYIYYIYIYIYHGLNPDFAGDNW